MDIDFGQILPNPTGENWSSGRKFMAGDTCYDEYGSEWLSLDDDNTGHALPGYYTDGMPKESDWWHCLVNMKKVSDAASHANTQGDYAKLQGDRSKSYLDMLDEEISEDAKAGIATLLFTPHVEGSTLVFPSSSAARISQSTLILTE